MVLAGQYLERTALVDAGGLVLEGLYHRGERRPALLVCPHTGGGGGMDAPPVAELAWAASRAGLPSLRFQHRGVGASQGVFDPSSVLEDAEAALKHLAETSGPHIALAGFEGGCSTALALAHRHPEVSRIALVSPVDVSGHPLPAGRVLALVPEEQAGRAAGLVAQLGSRGVAEIVPGADALFRAGLPALGRAVIRFVTERG